jgi:hypothetical protein
MGFARVEAQDAKSLKERFFAGRSDGLRKSNVTRLLFAAM